MCKAFKDWMDEGVLTLIRNLRHQSEHLYSTSHGDASDSGG